MLPSYGDSAFYRAFNEYKQYNPEAKLWVAPRPFSDKAKYEAQLSGAGLTDFTVFEGGTFRDLIQRASYLVSWVSTVVVEGVVTRTPTIMLTRNDFLSDHFNGEGSYLISPENEIVENLKKVNEVSVEMVAKCDEKASYYNFDDDGKAVMETVYFPDATGIGGIRPPERDSTSYNLLAFLPPRLIQQSDAILYLAVAAAFVFVIVVFL